MSEFLQPRQAPPEDIVTIEVDHGQMLTYKQYYITNDAQVWHLVEWARALRALGVDTETSGLFWWADKVATTQIGNPLVADPRAYIIDMRLVSYEALAPVRALCADPKFLKLGQNLKFEMNFLGHNHDFEFQNVADTQLNELVIRQGLLSEDRPGDSEDGEGINRAALKHTSMEQLCLRYLGVQIDKDKSLRTSFFSTPPGELNLRQRTYGCGDVIYPFYIARHQKAELEDRALLNIAKIEWELLPVVSESERRGIAIDEAGWRDLWQESVVKEQEVVRKLDAKILGFQGDLFGGLDANVRPLYMKSPKSKPVPLNWDSAIHARWAVNRYCRAIGWTHEVVFEEKRRAELKLAWGGEYWDKKNARAKQRRKPQLPFPSLLEVMEDEKLIPDYVIPEDRFCLLMQKDKDTLLLAKIRKQLPGDLVDELMDFSKYHKRITSFGINWLNKNCRKGVVHTEFHQALTNTGRMASAPNLQNISNDPRFRACFKPRPGYVFVTLDFSQVEPRLSAEASGDENYIATFREADDIYCRVAEAMTGSYPDKHQPDGKKTRKAFKIVVLSMAYRMGPGKLRDRITKELNEDVSPDYAFQLWSGFLEKHEKIKEYQQQCEHEASHWHWAEDGERVPNPRRIWDRFLGDYVTWVEGPCGRKRFFPPTATAIYTEAPNAPIQGTSATITKASAIMVKRWIRANNVDAFIVNYVHDELVWEVREDQARALADAAKTILQETGAHWIKSVPVVADFPEKTTGITRYWTKGDDEKAVWGGPVAA